MITRKETIQKIKEYLTGDLTEENLVDWAEDAIMNEDFEENYYEPIRNSIARLGVADVKAFGLSWKDCEDILESLGCKIKIEFLEVA
jgi:hypothetical protein